MFRKSAFTLVELLVVVAIITMLAAMLLPTLERSLESARRIEDLSHLKQLVLLTTLYANNNDDSILYTGTYWVDNMSLRSTDLLGGGHFYPNSFMGSAFLDPPTTGRRYTLARGAMRLVTEHLVDDPGILFCPSVARPFAGKPDMRSVGPGPGWLYDKPAYQSYWTSMVQKRYAITYAAAWYQTLMYCQDPAKPNGGFCQPSLPNVTFTMIAQKWSNKGNIGPMLYACSNTSPTTDTTPYWAHGDEGVNAGYFDGSSRWVSRDEAGWGSYSLVNCSTHAGFNVWERASARLAVR